MPSIQPIKAARGVRDILPKDRAAWAVVERGAVRAARRYGYQDLLVPIIEPLELIERGVGGDTDVVRKEMYRLEPHSDSSARLALRPEATASVVRAYFEGGLNQAPQPARLFTLGPMFRHDKPQYLRYRQFYQFDVEVIGDRGAPFDAEVIEMSKGWLTDLGLARISLELNSIGDQACRPAYLEKLTAYYRPLKDKLHYDCQRRIESNPLRLLDCKEEQCQPFKSGAPKITDNLCEACAAHFEEVRRHLDAGGIEYRLNPYLVRGLDYYTRTVFEFQHTALGGAQNALGGGGRYDGLAAELGYPATPGVGFAAGLDRIVAMLAEEGEEVVPAPPARVLVLPATPEQNLAAAQVGRLCRSVVACAVDYTSRSLKAKMRSAAKTGVPIVAILGEDEAARQVVQLRDMHSGEQSETSWDRLPEAFA